MICRNLYTPLARSREESAAIFQLLACKDEALLRGPAGAEQRVHV